VRGVIAPFFGFPSPAEGYQALGVCFGQLLYIRLEVLPGLGSTPPGLAQPGKLRKQLDDSIQVSHG
jgi:hypothetical protein